MKVLNKVRFGSFYLAAFIILLGCSEGSTDRVAPNANQNDSNGFGAYTGKEVSYELVSASDFNMSGKVTLKERTDKSTDVVIELTGTTGSTAQFPVHLHLGDISTPDANVAAWLNPVEDATGLSKTHVKHLADESPISFNELKNLDACIKIHLPYPEGATVVLAAGNIGTAQSARNSAGRVDIAICGGR